MTFAVRLYVLTRLSFSPYFKPVEGDMKFYNDWALRIVHGQLAGGRAFYGLPGYAVILAGLYRLIGFDTFAVPFAAGVLQSVADGLTAVFIWKISQELFASPSTTTSALATLQNESANLRNARAAFIGIVAALGWAFFQPAQTFTVILMPTAWLVAAFWFCVWRIVSVKKASVWQPWLGLGVLIGVVAMVVATILFLVPLTVVAILLLWKKETQLGKARWLKAALTALLFITGVFAGTAPCWIYNYFIAHEPVLLSAHSGINFYIGNNPIANGYPRIPPGMRAGQEGMLKDSITMAEIAAGHPLKYFEVSQFWAAKAHDYISRYRVEWLRLMLRKFSNFWNAFQYDDLSVITLLSNDGILTPGIKFGLVASLAIPGAIFAIRKYRRAFWIAAAVLLHMSALMPVFVTERYRLAAVPGLLLFMAFGMVELWDDLVHSQWIQAGSYLALSAAATVFVSWPTNDPGLWSLDYYNTGAKACDVGRLDVAQKNLEIAWRYVPDNSEINFALGNLWYAKGDRTRAKQFYRRAIEINPRHSSAYNNLGVLAIEEERWDVATAFLQRSLEIEPDDAKTHYLLAKVKLTTNDIAAARKEINEALRLKPQQKEFRELAEEISKQ